MQQRFQGSSLKQWYINLLSSELRQPVLAIQESERRVICQAEAAGKLGSILQFSTLWVIFFSSPWGSFQTKFNCFLRTSALISEWQAPTKDIVKLFEPYQSKGNVGCYSEEVEMQANVSESDILPADSWYLCWAQVSSSVLSFFPISLSFSCSMNWNFLINFLCSMPIGFESSLQAVLAVSTGQNQSWWMWWTVNVYRPFSMCIFFEYSSQKRKDWLKVFFPYWWAKACFVHSDATGFFQFLNCIIIV